MSLHMSRNIHRIFDRTAFQEGIESLFEKVKTSLPPETIRYLDKISQRVMVGFGTPKNYQAVTTFVRPGDIVPEGAIFMDFHFAEANSNVLLGTSLDPVSKTPDYKLCAVRIENPNGDHVESEGMDMV